MKYEEYFLKQIHNLTGPVLDVLLVVSMVCVLILFKNNNKLKVISRCSLIGYNYFIYVVTVISRISVEGRGHNFSPFWSYTAILSGKAELIVENALNILLFLPLGFLLGLSFHNLKWWHVCIYGLLVSFSIELFQYFLNKGFSETDDVIHNVVGCIAGWGLFKMVSRIERGFHNGKRIRSDKNRRFLEK